MPVSLEKARGFFKYHVVLNSTDSSHRCRQSSARIIEVSFNETSVNITELDPQLTYTLTAIVVVVSETGQLLEGPSVHPSQLMLLLLLLLSF